MRRCVFEKDPLRIFAIGASILLVVVAQPDEELANRTQKRCSAMVSLGRRKVLGS